MYFLYSILFGAWVALMFPFFLYNAIVKKKYLPSLGERMGNLPGTLKHDGRMTIWFHACSVGETLSVQPLAHLMHERFPEAKLVFSVITQTGRKIADDRFAKYGAGNAFYFPIDEPVFANKVLDHVQPDILITIDTEIWPNVLRACKLRGIPVVMANGRVSAESFQYYQWAQPLLGPVFQNYTKLLMKAGEDAARIQRMGAPPSKIAISGNLKYDKDVVEKDVSDAQRAAISKALGLDAAHGPIIVAGSTHPGEEESLFNVLRRLREREALKNVRLLLAPRHPDRFQTVAALAERMGLCVARRSENAPNPQAQLLLLDSVGELAAAYQFGTVTFVGGTLIPHGGQSIMEPALYGKAIVVGPHMENFPGIIDEFLATDAICQIAADETDVNAQEDQLTDAFAALLSDAERRSELGIRAEALFAGSKGATAFTMAHIAEILENKPSPASRNGRS